MLKRISILIMLLLSFFIVTSCTTADNNKKVDEVINLINEIPTEITIESESLINKALNAFEKLTEDEKLKVTNKSMLENAVNRLEKIKNDLENQEKAKIVIDDINLAIEETDLLKKYEFTILARKNYNGLSLKQKQYVTNYQSLKDLETYFDNILDNANKVITKIEYLPEIDNVNMSDKGEILEIKMLFDELDENTKLFVSNQDKLNNLLEKITELENDEISKIKAKEFDDLVNSLPKIEELTILDEEKINNAKELYDSLNNTVKSYVTTKNKLDALENKLLELKQIEEYKNLAEDVIKLIEELPSVNGLKISDEENLIKVRNEYNNLISDAKSYVTNLEKLELLEVKLLELKQIEEYKNLAKVVVDKITALPSLNEIAVDDKLTVNNIREEYDALDENVKKYVTNYTKLVNLENRINDIESAFIVENLINNLPRVDELRLTDKDKVEQTRKEYDTLNATAKTYVSNLEKLELLEEQLKVLGSTNEFEVKFYLNGGHFENITSTPTEVFVDKTSININHLNGGFFDVSSNAAAIYSKTALLNSGSTFAYNLKVGFSYSNNENKYIVDSIIANGTSINSSNIISEYYIIVNATNSSDYEKIESIIIGDYIELNKTLSIDNVSSSFGATLIVQTKTLSSSSDYVLVKFSGYTVLEKPLKSGYIFEGFYTNVSCTGEKVPYVYQDITLYACWRIDNSSVDTGNILDCVSTIATSYTKDHLILENDDATFSWTSSNPSLYKIENGIGSVSRVYQTHKKQTVTISVTINYKDGTKETKQKNITINPVLFEDFPDTPVATYFQVSAVSTYKNYNPRYKENQTMFSETTKEALNIIYYSFANPSANGSVSISNTSYIEEISKLKEHNVRMILCIDGVGSSSSSAYQTITASDSLTNIFVKNIMDLVEKYNFDGVDIDWEAVSTSICPNAAGMERLMKALRNEMALRQEDGGTPYFLSCAIPAADWGSLDQRFGFATLNNYVDYVNMMSYDLHNPSISSHVAPLYKPTYGYKFSATTGVETFTKYGLDKSKIIIGCAGYGKTYALSGTVSSTSKTPGLGVSGSLTNAGVAGSYNSGTIFGNGIEILKATGRYIEYHEYNSSGQFVGSYIYSSSDNRFITYDSSFAVKQKYNYAKQYPGMGLMCWAYTEDTNDIVINAIYEAMNE